MQKKIPEQKKNVFDHCASFWGLANLGERGEGMGRGDLLIEDRALISV